MNRRPDAAGTPDEVASVPGSQAIDRALGILLCFTLATPVLQLKDIANQTGLTMPTAHRMLKALQKSGFIVQQAADGSYRVGPAVVNLAGVALNATTKSSLAAIAMPYLDELRNETGETAGLHMPWDDGRVCVAEAESRHLMRMASGVGRTFPWHAGAASKALLSGETPEGREAILDDAGWQRFAAATPQDRTRLLTELDAVARDGYALSISETVDGASAIAVPVRGPNGDVVAAVNVTGPSVRWTDDRMVAALPLLRAVIARIERDLGTVALAEPRATST